LEQGTTVKELTDKLSMTELNEWIAYYKINPFGTYRKDLNTAYICMSIYGAAGCKTAKISDFMPEFNHVEKPINHEQIANDLHNFFKRAS
jgi:hypothetical protein